MKIFLFILSIIIISSCKPEETHPPEPYIEFISIDFEREINDIGTTIYTGELKFYFIDGDGDIGFPPRDSTPTIYLDRYVKIDDEFIKQELETETNFYIDVLPSSGYRPIEGEIIIDGAMFDIASSIDTILINNPFKYKFYIIDRAFNTSNVESTNEIILKELF